MERKMDPNSKPAPAAALEKEEVLFKWNHQIKMLFNATLWKTFFAIFGIPITLLGLLIKFVGHAHHVLLAMAGIFAFFFVIWIIAGIIIDLMGGFYAKYVITSKGIYFASGKKERAIADAATVVGVLAGSLGATGTGLLARSEQDNSVEWEKIKKVKVRKSQRYIFIREGFGSKPIGLYCNKENFEPVLALVRSKFKG
jgi:hypothetical protein